jgi:Na+/glutamate symporter
MGEKEALLFIMQVQLKIYWMCLLVCIVGMYIMENTSVAGLDPTSLEEFHGHGY